MTLRTLEPIAAPPANQPSAGRPVKLDYLPISALRVDDTYQRDMTSRSLTNIQHIINRFSWRKFSPLVVVPSGEGGNTYANIDGQHRTIAALTLGFDKVPCAIVDATTEEAAEIFAAINGTVTPMTPMAIFKAARAAGETWAKAVQKACDAAGVTPLVYPVPFSKQKPLQTMCVGIMRRIYERHGESVLKALLQTMVAPPEAQTKGYLTASVLRSYVGMFLTRPGWVRDPSNVAKAMAKLSPLNHPPFEIEKILESKIGDGRTSATDENELRAKVQDLKARRFGKTMVAASLRLPYADVERLWEVA